MISSELWLIPSILCDWFKFRCKKNFCESITRLIRVRTYITITRYTIIRHITITRYTIIRYITIIRYTIIRYITIIRYTIIRYITITKPIIIRYIGVWTITRHKTIPIYNIIKSQRRLQSIAKKNTRINRL